MIYIELDATVINRALREIPNRVKQVQRRAMTTTTKKLRSRAIKTSPLAARQRALGERTKGRVMGDSGEITWRGRSMPLTEFTTSTIGRGRRRLVVATIKKGKRSVVGGGFKHGRSVLRRRGRARYPITGVFTTGPAAVATDDAYMNPLIEEAQGLLEAAAIDSARFQGLLESGAVKRR